jgi:hypothetical protein
MEVKPVEFVYSISNEQLAISNSIVRIPITVKNFKELVAMQYTLHFDNNNYEFIGIENNQLDIDFNEKQGTKNGLISFLWTDKNAVERTLEDGTELFTLVLTQKGIGNLELGISEAITDIAAWDKDYNPHTIILTKRETINDKLEARNEWFSVSPNPTNGAIKVDIVCKMNKLIRLELSNVEGKKVKTQLLGMGTNTIDISNLSKGMYFVSIITSKGKNTKKLIIE